MKRLLLESIGGFIRKSGTASFRGKGRVIDYWLLRRPRDERRMRTLPGGARIACDLAHDYDCMVYLGQEEEQDLRALLRLLKPGDTFIDCGANIGLWTLTAASAVGCLGRVIAFEPNPATFVRLTENAMHLNDFGSRSQLIEAAVGDRIGRAALRAEARHNVSCIGSDGAPDTVSVAMTTIDTVVAGSAVMGLKIDVEGHELQALQGAVRLIERHKPWLCVEFNTLICGTRVLGEWPVDRFLRERGYKPAHFHQAGLPDAANIGPEWIARGYVNLLYR